MNINIGDYTLTLKVEATTEPVAVTASLWCFFKPFQFALAVQGGVLSITLAVSKTI